MVGRPPLTNEQKDDTIKKLEPYLKAGLSLRKACFQAQVPKSTVYDYLQSDEEFSDKIKQIEQSVSVRLVMVMSNHLSVIEEKQTKGGELSAKDINFLKWYAVTSRATREEFSKREEISSGYDPEEHIQRVKNLIDEAFANQ